MVSLFLYYVLRSFGQHSLLWCEGVETFIYKILPFNLILKCWTLGRFEQGITELKAKEFASLFNWISSFETRCNIYIEFRSTNAFYARKPFSPSCSLASSTETFSLHSFIIFLPFRWDLKKESRPLWCWRKGHFLKAIVEREVHAREGFKNLQRSFKTLFQVHYCEVKCFRGNFIFHHFETKISFSTITQSFQIMFNL